MIPIIRLKDKSRLIISNESKARSVIRIKVAIKEAIMYFFDKKKLTKEENNKLVKEMKRKIISQLLGGTNRINPPTIKVRIITLASFINFYYNLKNMISLTDSKQEIINKFALKKGDTGSPEVQAALLTLKIKKLTKHLEENKKDNHSRRGLLKVIAKRRRILNYLQKLDEKRYKKLVKELGLTK